MHVLPLQSYCTTGVVNDKTEFTTKGAFQSFPTSTNPSNPFQSSSIRLSDPMCLVATNRIRDLTADGQRLTRSDSQRLGLSKLFTVHTCSEYKLLVMNELLKQWINIFSMGWMFSYKASPEPAARSSSSTATENMVCVEAELEEDALFYTWHLIRLSERRMTHSPICIIQRGVKCWLRCYMTGGQDHRSFTRFCIIW